VLHAVLLAGACLASGAGAADEERSAFRPCIDPSNLPFANEHGDGFENRIAALFAQKLGLPVKSYAFPQRMNFIRNTLRYRLPGEDFRCDVVMSVPAEYEQVATTRPYYRSTYVLVYPKGRGLDQVHTGADFVALPQKVRENLRIGIHDRSPASLWLVRHGMEAQARRYPMMSPDPDRYPGELIDHELASGRIDAAIVWGPIAGWYAKRVKGMDVAIVPLASEPGIKFDYAIAMGVRFGERAWKETVEKLIADNQPAIDAILAEYGVPLVNERGEAVGKAR
jgi:quinoprotein dehydrogenase-associated probable ABC transporter substrate-binding protein